MITKTHSIITCLSIFCVRFAVAQIDLILDSAEQMSLSKTVTRNHKIELDFRALFPESTGELYIKQFYPDDYLDSDDLKPAFTLKNKTRLLKNSSKIHSCIRMLRVGANLVLSLHENNSISLYEVSSVTGLRTRLLDWHLPHSSDRAEFLRFFFDEDRPGFAFVLWRLPNSTSTDRPPGEAQADQLALTELRLAADESTQSLRYTTFKCEDCNPARIKLVVDPSGLRSVLLYGHRSLNVSAILIDLDSFEYSTEVFLVDTESSHEFPDPDEFEIIATPHGFFLYMVLIAQSENSDGFFHSGFFVSATIDKHGIRYNLGDMDLLEDFDFIPGKEQFAKPVFIKKLTKQAEDSYRLVIAVRGFVFDLSIGKNRVFSIQRKFSTADALMQYQSITSLEAASDGSYLLVLESDRCLYLAVVDAQFTTLRYSRHLVEVENCKTASTPVLLADAPGSANHLLVTCEAVMGFDPRDILVGSFEAYSGKVTGLISSRDRKRLRYEIDVIKDLNAILLPDIIFQPIFFNDSEESLTLNLEGNRLGIKANNLTLSLQLHEPSRSKAGVSLNFSELSWKQLAWTGQGKFGSFLRKLDTKNYAHYEDLVVGFDQEGNGSLFRCSLFGESNPTDLNCTEIRVSNGSLQLSKGHIIKAFIKTTRQSFKDSLILISSNSTGSEVLIFRLDKNEICLQNIKIDSKISIIDGELRDNLHQDIDFIGAGFSMDSTEYSLFTLKFEANRDEILIGEFVQVSFELKFPRDLIIDASRNHRYQIYLLQALEETDSLQVLTWLLLRVERTTGQYVVEEARYAVIDLDVFSVLGLCEEGLLLVNRKKQAVLLRSLTRHATEDTYLHLFPSSSFTGQLKMIAISQYCLIATAGSGFLFDLSGRNSHPLNRLIRSFDFGFDSSSDFNTLIPLLFVNYTEMKIVICSQNDEQKLNAAAYFHRIKSLTFSLTIQKPKKIHAIEVILQSSPTNSSTWMLPLIRNKVPKRIMGHPIHRNHSISEQGQPIPCEISQLLAVDSQIKTYKIDPQSPDLIALTNTITRLSALESQAILDRLKQNPVKSNSTSKVIYNDSTIWAVRRQDEIIVSYKNHKIHRFSIGLPASQKGLAFSFRLMNDSILMLESCKLNNSLFRWRFFLMGLTSSSKVANSTLQQLMTQQGNLNNVMEDTRKRKLIIFGKGEQRKGRRNFVFSLIQLNSNSPNLPMEFGFNLVHHPDSLIFEPDCIFKSRYFVLSSNTQYNIVFGVNTNQVEFHKLTVELESLKIAHEVSVAGLKDLIITEQTKILFFRPDLLPLFGMEFYIRKYNNTVEKVKIFFSKDGNTELTTSQSTIIVLPDTYEITGFDKGNYNSAVYAKMGSQNFCFLFDANTNQLIHVVEVQSSEKSYVEIDRDLFFIENALKDGSGSGQVFRKDKASLIFKKPRVTFDVLSAVNLTLIDVYGQTKSIPLSRIFAADSLIPPWIFYVAGCVGLLGLLSAILLYRYDKVEYSIKSDVPGSEEDRTTSITLKTISI